MKDGQNLTEYANLDTGKVVHLVVRPPGVQANPQNDEPRPQTNNRRTYSRGMPRFPFMSGGFPMMEGYTFITLDVGDRTNPLSSLMEGLTGPLGALRSTRDSTTPTSTTTTNNNTSNRNRETTPSTNAFSTTLPRPQFEHQHLGSSSTNTTENRSSTATTSSSNTQFPASVEVRLMRTMGCMRNVRTILDTPTNQSISGIATTSSTSPEVANEIRARLRGNGNSQTAAVGLVLDELATLMTDVIPRLREMSNALRAGDRVANSEENMNLYRRVLRTARIIQGMSLIYHFLGSVLAAADVSPRRIRTRTSSSTPAQSSRSDTTATNTPAPLINTDNTTTTTSTSIDQGDGSQQETRGVKRKTEEDHHSSTDVGEGSSSSGTQEKKGKSRKEDN